MNRKEDMFCLTVQFDQNITTPHILFKSIADMLIEFHKIDKLLASTIISDIEPVFVLEQVEQGSIKVWLRQLLVNISDDAINELDAKKLLGSFLVKGKYKILEKMDDKNLLDDPKKIDVFALELKQLSEETKYLLPHTYGDINKRELLMEMNEVSRIAGQLPKDSKFTYEVMEERISISKSFNAKQEFIERISDVETIRNTDITMILKIKQPDYLGKAQWVFKYDQKNLYASIEDDEWLDSFRHRKIDIKPGDSLRVKVSYETMYDKYQNVMSEKYVINKVLDVISIEEGVQEVI